MKIQITQKQAEQFNNMLETLRRISKSYEVSEKLLNKDFDDGLDGDERLMYAYDNIQSEAKTASHGVCKIDTKSQRQKILTSKQFPEPVSHEPGSDHSKD